MDESAAACATPDARSQPDFSVLIATFNQAAYITETLASVEAQSCNDYELVIVDDGSTDATEEVVRAWVHGYRQRNANRVVYTRLPNSGQSAALEHGFALCSGRYICLLDSDDRWLPHKLQEVRGAARHFPDAGTIAHPLCVIDAEGNRTGAVRPRRARLSDGDLRAQVGRTGRVIGSASSGIVIKREVFRQLLPMPTKQYRAAADHYLTLGASLLAPVHALNEPLAEYRLHSDGHHLRSMLSVDGLRGWIALQQSIAKCLQIEEALQRDPFFTRHVFAVSKLEEDVAQQFAAFRRLLAATAIDPGFRFGERVLLIGYWTLCLLAPRPLFSHLWRAFQLHGAGGVAPES